MNYKAVLKILLFSGFTYFFSLSIAHMAGWKVPALFIYFEIPSYTYQDKIISVLAMGWALFYLQAAFNPQGQRTIIQVLLTSGGLALIGLAVMTLQTDFKNLNPAMSESFIWYQIITLALYFIALFTAYKKTSRKRKRKI